MSADQITPERIAELRWIAQNIGATIDWPKVDHIAVLDAITAYRAEVQRLTSWKEASTTIMEGLQLQEIGQAIDAKLGTDIGPQVLPWILTKKAEVQSLTERNVSMEAEIRILAEEARRSDAGRVEVPERAAWLTIEEMADSITAAFPNTSRLAALAFANVIAKASIAKGSRLSPSPQPAIQIAHIGDSMRDSLQPDGSVLTERWTRGELVERVASQPSADVVVVPKNPRSFDAKWGDALSALRSSTNHDAQDAGEGR